MQKSEKVIETLSPHESEQLAKDLPASAREAVRLVPRKPANHDLVTLRRPPPSGVRSSLVLDVVLDFG